MVIYKSFRLYSHHFHLVTPSPWPIVVAFSLWLTILNIIAFLHQYTGTIVDVSFGFSCLFLGIGFWWRDVIRESTFEVKHTSIVRQGLLFGIGLFIVSEAILFFGFFWGFFHSILIPSGNLGGTWPPVYLIIINPLVNTILLIISGISLTIAHRYLKDVSFFDTNLSFIQIRNVVVSLLMLVIMILIFDYFNSSLSYADNLKPSTVYVSVNPNSIAPAPWYLLYLCGIVYGVEIGVLTYILEKKGQTLEIEQFWTDFLILMS